MDTECGACSVVLYTGYRVCSAAHMIRAGKVLAKCLQGAGKVLARCWQCAGKEFADTSNDRYHNAKSS